jgi:hypothetical protein
LLKAIDDSCYVFGVSRNEGIKQALSYNFFECLINAEFITQRRAQKPRDPKPATARTDAEIRLAAIKIKEKAHRQRAQKLQTFKQFLIQSVERAKEKQKQQ